MISGKQKKEHVSIRRNRTERRLARFALAALLALLMMPALIAVGSTPARASDAYGVYDFENLLTAEQASALAEKIRAFEEKNGFRVFFLTAGAAQTGGYMDQNSIDFIEAFGESTIADPYIGLLVNMDTRYFYIDLYGNEPLSSYTDDKQDAIESDVVERLYSEDIYGAASAFIEAADYQANYDPRLASLARGGVTSGVIGAIGSSVAMARRKKKHTEKALATDADLYADPGSLALSLNRDVFSHQFVTRVARLQNSRGGGFGSGFGGGHTTTHTSFGGGSHSGGGGHF